MDYLVNKNGTQILIETGCADQKQKIVERFKAIRVQMKLSQEQIAHSAGMARPDVSRFESGSYNPSLELMIRYANALGCDLSIELKPREKGEQSHRD